MKAFPGKIVTIKTVNQNKVWPGGLDLVVENPNTHDVAELESKARSAILQPKKIQYTKRRYSVLDICTSYQGLANLGTSSPSR